MQIGPMHIALLAYDGISPFMLSTPLAVFGEPFLGGSHDVWVCGEKKQVSATGGLSIETPFGLQQAGSADVVVVPGWRGVDDVVPPAIIDEIRKAEERGAIIAGLCLGAFVLAEAGVLDNRRATTHWAQIEIFASRFPRVQVDPGAIFVDEGKVLTSAGIASGMDCCLHILARLSGNAEANRVARHLVVAQQRSGSQPQLIERPAPNSTAERRVANILHDLLSNPEGTPSLDVLANLAGMSRRSFSRYIRAQTGDNLGAWLRRSRVALAQDLLLKGANGLEQIASRCGFPDAKSLRAAFRKEVGATPRQWRARQRID